MPQPPVPALPPDFQPPSGDGGYGGDLQSYGQPGYGQPNGRGHGYSPIPSTTIPSFPTASYPGGQTSGQPPAPWPSVTTPTHPAVGYPALPSTADGGSPPQRPAVVGLAATLAATASLQWVCALSFCWLVATAGAAQLGTSGLDGGVYHLLNRFNYRMLDGLAWPLYLFPVASFVLSFLLLARRAWARLAYTATGAAALLWSAWWLRDDFVWWFIPAGYIALAVLVLWTADATRWYRWKPASDPAGQPS